jgi:hypothetical protein
MRSDFRPPELNTTNQHKIRLAETKRRERIIPCQKRRVSRTRKRPSRWHIVVLKILSTPDLNEEVEKTGDREKTGEKVRMRHTKDSSEEVAKKDDPARIGESQPNSSCSLLSALSVCIVIIESV